MRFIFIISLVSIFTISCESDIDPANIERGRSFYPLKTGDLRIYSVEEVVYNIDGSVDDLTYYIKEEIVESFLTADDSTFIIYRYKRYDESTPWVFLETRQSRSNDNQVILFEGNTPYLKLTFPISAGNTWDGNLLNGNEEDIYIIDSVYARFNSELQFDRTLTVIQNDNQDYIVELDRRYEIYGFDIGLIIKEEILYTYCTDDNCLGQQQIETGRKYTETLIEYAL